MSNLSIGGYYGGKQTIVPWLLSLCPTGFSRYLEPFCGFASLGLNIESSDKLFADKNEWTIAALRDIRDRPGQVISALSNFHWGKESFKQIKGELLAPDSTPGMSEGFKAIAFSAMAFQRGGSCSGFSSRQCDRAKKRSWDYLNEVSERLQKVRLLCISFDSNTLFSDDFIYLDPPYLDGGEHYAIPMNKDEHLTMLRWAISSRSKIMLSGYHSPLYDSLLSTWKVYTKPTRSNARNNKEECVWLNYDINDCF